MLGAEGDDEYATAGIRAAQYRWPRDPVKEKPTELRKKRPGPRRRRGAPVGREEVRRAVLDAAADLFAREGVTEVTLREIAAAADVQLSLISRYIGNRTELIRAVFDDLTEALSREVVERPLEQISFERDSVMGRWTIMLTHFAVTAPDELPRTATFNPMLALAEVIMDNYGLDERSARLRGAQIVASALGWRIFETYLVESGQVDIEPEVLRDELSRDAPSAGRDAMAVPTRPDAQAAPSLTSST